MVGAPSASLVTVTTLLLSCFLPEASAFWRLPCNNPVSLQRADPIVNPGAVSGHMHTIMGGNGFDFTMDFKKARSSTCSSCTVKQDLSNYWVPNLFYAAQNGSFTPVKQVTGAVVYYLQRRSTPDEKLLAFPEGFRMLAGDPMLRSYTDTKEQRAITYACLDDPPSPETHGFPNKNCPNGLRVQVFFPSCWNGRDLDSADHKSHMAYPDGVDSGKCPSTHPVRFISIFYEVMYSVDDFKNQWYGNKQPFVLANGDPTGYGSHGDFINGWDVAVLQKAVDGCNDNSGVVERCPFFEFFPSDTVSDCFVPPRVDEPTTGWFDRLPGCNAIQSGPGRATQATGCGATTVIGPPKSYSTDVSSRGWGFVGCSIDNLGSRTFPIRMNDGALTVEKCIDYCVSQGNAYAGVQYANECYCGNTAPPADRMGFKCDTPCAGNNKQVCGGPLRLSVYKKNGAKIRRDISDRA